MHRTLSGEQDEATTIDGEFKNGKAIVRVVRLPDFRPAGLNIGDTVANYRAALDHLVWDLVQLGTHSRLTPQQAMQVQFPLANSYAAFARDRNRRTPGISDDHVRILRQYQPYQRGDRGRAIRLLREISDKDKHRTITPTVACATGFVGKISVRGCTVHNIRQYASRRALYVGAQLMSMDVINIDAEPQVNIESQMAVEPGLGRGVMLAPTMVAIRGTVLEILSRFDALL